jgi:hypothetical protein
MPFRHMFILTVGQASIITLNVEVQLNHLAPTPWSCNSKHISNIVSPPVNVYSGGHHPRMDEVEGVWLESEPIHLSAATIKSWR